jgi:predicted phage terminase large subunit-like protein
VIRSIYLPQPLAHQQECLDDPARYKVCCWGRQCGKTAMCSIAVVWGHGPMVDGRPLHQGAIWGASIWWVTKDYPTAEKIWRDLKGYVSRWGGDLEISESMMRIVFPGGGRIEIKSAATSGRKSGGLRGDTIHGLVIDEAAFCPEDTWEAECRPMLMRYRGWVIFISTPDGQNWFHDKWCMGAVKKISGWRSWHLPSSSNPTLHPDELAAIQETCDKYKWAREYLAEFNVAGGVIFERQWFKTYVRKHFEVQRSVGSTVELGFQAYDEGREFGGWVPREGMYVFVTADMALTVKTASDYTAIAAWGASPDGRLWLLDLWRGKLEVPYIIPKIREMYNTHSASKLIVEASGPLVRLNSEAVRLGMNVEEWHIHAGPLTESKDKVSRNGPAAPHVQAGRVLFPQDAPWLNEFIAECCAFPMGNHDDMVDCLGAAVWHRPPNAPPRSQNEFVRPSRERDWGIGKYRTGTSRWE